MARRRRRVATHLVLALITAAVCAVVFVLRPADPNVNRKLSLGLGYAGLLFLTGTLLIGPVQVLSRRRNPVNVYLRRDLGIWAAAAAGTHVVFGLQVHLQGRALRYFFAEEGRTTPLLNLFGLSNYAGAAATVILAMLLALSNDRSLRRLKKRSWKRLQRLNYLCFFLVAGHALGYQVVEDRGVALTLALLGLALLAAGGQTLGYVSLSARERAEAPSSDSQAFKARDAASYGPVLDQFERWTDRLSPPVAERLVALARLAPGARVLDVGAGTGVVALRAERGVGCEGRVVGIDLSREMVEAGRAKALAAGVADRVEFRVMDAEALTLPDRAFDAVLSLYALLHFPRPAAALSEMLRVLRPGGRLVLAVGSRPPLLSWSALMDRAVRLPELLDRARGRQLSAPELMNSLVRKHVPASEEPEESRLAGESLDRTRQVLALVRAAGFTEVRSTWEGHRAWLETPEEFWDLQRTFSSFARKRLAGAPPASLAALREEFFERCRRVQARRGKLVYPYAAFYVAARRPATGGGEDG